MQCSKYNTSPVSSRAHSLDYLSRGYFSVKCFLGHGNSRIGCPCATISCYTSKAIEIINFFSTLLPTLISNDTLIISDLSYTVNGYHKGTWSVQQINHSVSSIVGKQTSCYVIFFLRRLQSQVLRCSSYQIKQSESASPDSPNKLPEYNEHFQQHNAWLQLRLH